jgi:5-methylcytosine-specific restriction endonuclease McrA
VINRYTPIKRSPVRKRRTKPRPGRLKGEELDGLRTDCFRRDHGICQRCEKKTNPGLPQEHDDSYHMAHRTAKAKGGDNLDNVQVECGGCHRKWHSYGPSMEKPVPRKVLE